MEIGAVTSSQAYCISTKRTRTIEKHAGDGAVGDGINWRSRLGNDVDTLVLTAARTRR